MKRYSDISIICEELDEALTRINNRIKNELLGLNVTIPINNSLGRETVGIVEEVEVVEGYDGDYDVFITINGKKYNTFNTCIFINE